MKEVVSEEQPANVLFVEDEEATLRSLVRGVSARTTDLICHTAQNEAQAILLAKRHQPEVVVLDLNLEDGHGSEGGLRLIPKLSQFSSYARIIVLTGSIGTECGIRSVNAGAASFLSKPADMDHLVPLIKDGIEVARLCRKSKENDSAITTAIAALGLSTRSQSMASVLEQAAIAAVSPLPVLLCGETGVGKGLLARAIHKASARSRGPFVRVQPNFGSHDLIMSELCGHTKGSFTGANKERIGVIQQASGGSLFIDEIDTLPQQTQIALLNVLQEKEFQQIGSSKTIHSEFRLISATNAPFDSLVSESKLRIDFFYRIAHSIINIPPLRERRADIPDLAKEFVSKMAKKNPENAVWKLTNEASSWLAAQSWPGNVRELEATVERAYVQAQYYKRGVIQLSDLQKPHAQTAAAQASKTTLTEQLKIQELIIVSEAFAKHGQNHTATASALGIDRKRLKRILGQLEG